MEKKSVYIETSIISYLTSRSSRDLVAAAWQSETARWWELQRPTFDLYVSELVAREAARGDSVAAAKRLAVVQELPLLHISEEVIRFSNALVESSIVPTRAADDAIHIALAAVHGVDFLLTWNCRHIDNAVAKIEIRRMCVKSGYQCPEICTPSELMGEHEDAR